MPALRSAVASTEPARRATPGVTQTARAQTQKRYDTRGSQAVFALETIDLPGISPRSRPPIEEESEEEYKDEAISDDDDIDDDANLEINSNDDQVLEDRSESLADDGTVSDPDEAIDEDSDQSLDNARSAPYVRVGTSMPPDDLDVASRFGRHVDASNMQFFLDELHSDTDKMLNLMLPDNDLESMQGAGRMLEQSTRERELWVKHDAGFSQFKGKYSGEEDWIDIRLVLNVLFGERSRWVRELGPWRPDAILYNANMVTLFKELLLSVKEPSLTALVDAEKHFAPAVAGDVYTRDAFELSLSLTTQVALARLKDEQLTQEADIKELITDTFLATDSLDGRRLYRRWEALHIHKLGRRQQSDHERLVGDRIAALQAEFEHRGRKRGTQLKSASQTYPWSDVVEELLEYCYARRQGLDALIKTAGGVSAIQQAIKDIMSDVDAEDFETAAGIQSSFEHSIGRMVSQSRQPAETSKQTTPIDVQSPSKKPNRHGAAYTKHLMYQQSVKRSPSPAPPKQFEDNDLFVAENEPTPEPVERSSIARKRAYEADEIEVPRAAPASTAHKSPKTVHSTGPSIPTASAPPGSFEPTQDVGMGGAQASSRQQQAGRPSLVREDSDTIQVLPVRSSGQRAQTLPRRTTHHSRSRESTDDADDVPSASAGRAPQSTRPPVRIRSGGGERIVDKTAWTIVEIERLKLLMSREHGHGVSISWKHLWDRDGEYEPASILQHRRAEDLRYKAIGMKINMCVADGTNRHLPQAWQKVKLSKHKIEIIRAKGAEYDESL